VALDMRLAVKRLRSGIYEGGTLSGAKILDSASNYIEMYQFTFMDKLEALGVTSDESLEQLLAEVVHVQFVGDIVGYDNPDLAATCVFGLVLLDRLAHTGWGQIDFEECFYLHEQLFECFEVVLDANKRQTQARLNARKKAQKFTQARLWVQQEWGDKGAAYGNNKSDFARTYTGLVREKFKDIKGDPLRITEKTIREVWLAQRSE
jgi:hypothetical protein